LVLIAREIWFPRLDQGKAVDPENAVSG
jgi:hypothetical protein